VAYLLLSNTHLISISWVCLITGIVVSCLVYNIRWCCIPAGADCLLMVLIIVSSILAFYSLCYLCQCIQIAAASCIATLSVPIWCCWFYYYSSTSCLFFVLIAFLCWFISTMVLISDNIMLVLYIFVLYTVMWVYIGILVYIYIGYIYIGISVYIYWYINLCIVGTIH